MTKKSFPRMKVIATLREDRLDCTWPWDDNSSMSQQQNMLQEKEANQLAF